MHLNTKMQLCKWGKIAGSLIRYSSRTVWALFCLTGCPRGHPFKQSLYTKMQLCKWGKIAGSLIRYSSRTVCPILPKLRPGLPCVPKLCILERIFWFWGAFGRERGRQFSALAVWHLDCPFVEDEQYDRVCC